MKNSYDSPSELSVVDGELDVRGTDDCSLVLDESLPCESMGVNDFSIDGACFDDGWDE